jgi:hypothetical protein
MRSLLIFVSAVYSTLVWGRQATTGLVVVTLDVLAIPFGVELQAPMCHARRLLEPPNSAA